MWGCERVWSLLGSGLNYMLTVGLESCRRWNLRIYSLGNRASPQGLTKKLQYTDTHKNSYTNRFLLRQRQGRRAPECVCVCVGGCVSLCVNVQVTLTLW